MKYTLTILLSIILVSLGFSQTFENPIAGKTSHPNLEITQIKITDTQTIVSLKVTNQRNQGGWFCADKDILIKNSKGAETYNLIHSENIPTCPESFEFSYVGQILEFKLYFPGIPNNIKFIDLIENCDNACFYFNGIILDNDHNNKIRSFETGFDLFQKQEYKNAIPFFEQVLNGKMVIESHIFGLSYYYLIIANKKIGAKETLEYWYNALLESNIRDKQTFISELEKELE